MTPTLQFVGNNLRPRKSNTNVIPGQARANKPQAKDDKQQKNKRVKVTAASDFRKCNNNELQLEPNGNVAKSTAPVLLQVPVSSFNCIKASRR